MGLGGMVVRLTGMGMKCCVATTLAGWLPYTVPRKMVEDKKVFQLQSNKVHLS